MPLEQSIDALNDTLKELVAILKGGIPSLPTEPVKPTPQAKPDKGAKAGKAKAEPEPEKEEEEEEEEGGTTTSINPDTLIEQITETVKAAIVNAEDPDQVKAKWTAIRKRFKVEKISDLRDQPLKLIEALQEAEAL